jgi:hypothetical protein
MKRKKKEGKKRNGRKRKKKKKKRRRRRRRKTAIMMWEGQVRLCERREAWRAAPASLRGGMHTTPSPHPFYDTAPRRFSFQL